jgi:hypothetical protein
VDRSNCTRADLLMVPAGFALKDSSRSALCDHLLDSVVFCLEVRPRLLHLSRYSAPTVKNDLKTAFGTTVSIPIPATPTSYLYLPGVVSVSKIAGR